MHGKKPSRSLISLAPLYVTNAVLAIAIVFALVAISVQPAQAQTYTVLHNLNGLQDGYYPISGVTVARNGDLYGTTQYSGLSGGDCYLGCGTAFRLARKGSGWIFTTLYSFAGGNDGGNSYARVIFGPDGSLYGTTSAGGGGELRGRLRYGFQSETTTTRHSQRSRWLDGDGALSLHGRQTMEARQ